MWGQGSNTRTGAVGIAALLALLWASSGCGSGSTNPAAIEFKSPGIRADGFLSPGVHCGWGALWLPLKWGAVPDGTKELAIFIARFKEDSASGRDKPTITYADLIYHVNPTLRRNAANVLPTEAQWSAVGKTSCPTPWGHQKIAQAVFALERTRVRRLTRQEATRLTEEALQAERSSKPISGPPGPLREDATGMGSFVAAYAPGAGP